MDRKSHAHIVQTGPWSFHHSLFGKKFDPPPRPMTILARVSEEEFKIWEFQTDFKHKLHRSEVLHRKEA